MRKPARWSCLVIVVRSGKLAIHSRGNFSEWGVAKVSTRMIIIQTSYTLAVELFSQRAISILFFVNASALKLGHYQINKILETLRAKSVGKIKAVHASIFHPANEFVGNPLR